MTPLISSDRICVRFGGAEVLHDVSLAVRPGEIVTILGPNGSGKSTLIRALLGIVPLAHGAVTRAPGLRLGYALGDPQRLAVHEGGGMADEVVDLGQFLVADRLVGEPVGGVSVPEEQVGGAIVDCGGFEC